MQVYETTSEQETFDFGFRLGQTAPGGSVFALVGDLGTGKTVIARGMARGLGIQAPIVSPTFMILREYRPDYHRDDDASRDEYSGRLPFFHFDIYRLEDEDELYAIGWEDYINQNGVCLVEWADLVREAMPEETIWMKVEKDLSKGAAYRKISVGTAGEILDGAI